MKIAGYIFLMLFFISCSTQPQPLVPGKDVCQSCKMPVADPKFGAEIITEKGKLYKFDDIGCMFNFRRTGLSRGEVIKDIYATCYTNKQKVMKVKDCFFLKSTHLRSPMNSGTAAFESIGDAELFQKDFEGEVLSWEQLQQKLN